LTSSFLNEHPKIKGIIINEAERLVEDGKSLIDFQILQPPTASEFNKFISQDDIRVRLPYVGIIKAGKDGKIVTIGNIP
jgi:hypothetical protein